MSGWDWFIVVMLSATVSLVVTVIVGGVRSMNRDRR
jgi:hypothetical protein